MLKEKVINMPNILTLLRLIAIPFFVIFLFSNDYIFAFSIFFLMVIGDGLDGYISRKLKQTTEFGKAFDGLVDGVFIVVSLLSLLFLNFISLQWFIILLIPKALNFSLQLFYSKKKNQVIAIKSSIGKIATLFLYTAIILLIIDFAYIKYFLIFTAILLYIAGIKHAFEAIND